MLNHALVQISVANLIQPLITKSRTGGQLISNYELLKNSASAPSDPGYAEHRKTVFHKKKLFARNGGYGWTRTTDLILIRDAL